MANENKSKVSILTNGIIKENPVLRLVLGTCSCLAVTTAVSSALGMGAAFTFVLVCSNILISLLRNVIPAKVHLPCYIVIIAGFVTIVQMVMHAYMDSLYTALGVFLPLIVVNCIILGRAEMFACKNSVVDSALDGIGMGIGYTLTVTLMASIRENLGSDTLSYSMKAVLLRPDTAEQDGKTMVLASDVLIREVDLGSVSVPAGGTQVSRTVSLTASDIAAIRDLFPNGSYVEGFVILTAADGSAPQIGMPLLAFLGDWTSAPILDRANWFDEPQDGENVMNNDCTLGVNVVGSTIRSAGEVVNFLNLGQNIFDTDIAAEV